MGFPGGAVLKNMPANEGDAGDMGWIPGSGRSPGGGNGNLLQYSCLQSAMDRGMHLGGYSTWGYKTQDSPKQAKMHCPKMYLTWLWKQEFRKTLGHPTPSCLIGGGGDGRHGRNVVEGIEIETNRGIKVGGKTNSTGHSPMVHSNVNLPKPQVWDSFKRVFGKWQLKTTRRLPW